MDIFTKKHENRIAERLADTMVELSKFYLRDTIDSEVYLKLSRLIYEIADSTNTNIGLKMCNILQKKYKELKEFQA